MTADFDQTGTGSQISQPDSSSTPSQTGFAQLGLPAPLLSAVEDLGYTTPTAIQIQAIPILLEGRDLTGVAQTGTGKTAAFGLPLLSAIDPKSRQVQAIVLTPTRELALQVSEAISGFAAHLNVDVLAVYGGAPYVPQQRALADGVQVVVGTPGRVMDHMERGNLKLHNVRFVVLDEADEMLRMGFAEDVETIFAGIKGFTSDDGTRPQVALFSATMPAAIRAVADKHMVNPKRISVTPQSSTVDSVSQSYAIVPFRHKIGALTRIIATNDADATIVFCRTRAAAEEVGSALVEKGIAAATISGDVPQNERERIVERLKSGAIDVLVATDVAARGLDVDRIGLVVNFDIPREAEAYVHRIGRTGRAGRTGQAISFVTPSERSRLKYIENTTKVPIAEYEIPSPRDVSGYKASALLMQVADRRKAGRLDLYEKLVREAVLSSSDYNIIDPEKALELAAVLLALAVGDDGPRAAAEQAEFEAEQAQKRSASDVREARRRLADERGSDRSGKGGKRGDRDRGDRFDRSSDRSERDDDRGGRPGKRALRDRSDARGGIRYRVSVGHKDGVTPSGIVGALTGESDLRGGDIGKIDIYPSFTLVDINAPLRHKELDRLSRAVVAGRALRITEDKGPKGGKFGGGDRDRFGKGDRPNKRDRW